MDYLPSLRDDLPLLFPLGSKERQFLKKKILKKDEYPHSSRTDGYGRYYFHNEAISTHLSKKKEKYSTLLTAASL